MNKEDAIKYAKESLSRTAAFDKDMRAAFADVADTHSVSIEEFTASLSAMTWEIRCKCGDYGGKLAQAEIIATYLCAIRGIDGYPAAGIDS